MALAFVVTIEKDLPESAAYVKAKTGKALGRESDRLDSAARRKGAEPLTALLSESQAARRAVRELEFSGVESCPDLET